MSSEPERSETYGRAWDAAQQLVSARLHGDTERATQLAVEFEHPFLLIAALADLCLLAHSAWCHQENLGDEELRIAWSRILLSVELVRQEHGW